MPKVEEVEAFEALLAALPRAGEAAWRAAALRQLRGADLDSIDYALTPAISLSPYATTGGGESAPAGAPLPLVGIADVRGAAAAEAVAELEGGAQGIWLGRDAVAAAGAAGVRFDFITAVVDGLASADGDWFPLGIVAEQRVAARLWCTTEPEGAGALLREALGTFPQASVVVSGEGGHDDADTLGRVRAGFLALERALASTREAATLAERLVLRFEVGPSYPRTLVESRALELLYANLCAAAALSEPLPALRLWSVIGPSGGEASSESYLIDAACRAAAAATCRPAALTVKPFPAPDADRARERRRARNVVNVLQIETDLASAGDVLRGAAWVERAATELARVVWRAS